MQTTTTTFDDDLAAGVDEFMGGRRHANRSEAIRDLVRCGLGRATLGGSRDARGLGAVVYGHGYDHLHSRGR